MRKIILFAALVSIGFPALSEWKHEIKEDKMGRGSDEIATTKSLNELNLSQPYDGAQKASLSFRRLGKGVNEIVLSVQKGQIVCESAGCMVLFRIDSDEPFRIAMDHPKDGSSNVLVGDMTTNEQRKLLAAKSIFAEITLYQNGEQLVEFNADGNPFKGRTVYTVDEIKQKIKDKKDIATSKGGEIKIGESGFNICKQVLKDAKSEGDVNLVVKNTKDELVTESYSETSRVVTSCKKGVKHMLVEVYEYK